ncbi:MAG: hypothetical protein ACREP9_08625 [Candidatus Dormibacteraceae bacterium]
MSQSATNPFPEFKRLVTDGISADIYLAYEAHHIFRQIGERAQLADSSTYQPALVALQSYASAEFVLAVTRLLERQGQKYELHSVHGVLLFLRDHADTISIHESLWLEQSMQRLGLWTGIPHESGPDQTRAAVDALVLKLPHYTNSDALKALKELRDKRIAHPERQKPEDIVTTTLDEALKLLQVPVEALAVCGAYTSTAYMDNQGRYIMDTDAARAGLATRRLIEASQPPPRRPP